MTTREFDVLVLGGGLSGLAFAGLLHSLATGLQRDPSICILESGAPPPSAIPAEAALRVIAISLSSRAILEHCGAWAGIPVARVGPYRRMVVWQQEGRPGGRDSIMFDAAREGVPELGYIVENDVVRTALWQRIREATSIELIAGTAPVALTSASDAMTLRLADGGTLRAKLIVGADGGSSWLRSALNLLSRERPYGQQAVVAHVRSAEPHRQTAWQRFLAGGPLALLPLADGRCSIVWSCPEGRARELLAAPAMEFNQALTAASAGVLGDLQLTTPRASFGLAAGHASQYTGRRFALIGDAAHKIHPLAGQGVNLGFLDAAALAETLATHLSTPRADPGDPRALRRFERWRKVDNLATLGALDALHHLFTSQLPGVARAAGLGLGLVERLPPLKSRLADHALGRRGDLPRAARSAFTS